MPVPKTFSPVLGMSVSSIARKTVDLIAVTRSKTASPTAFDRPDSSREESMEGGMMASRATGPNHAADGSSQRHQPSGDQNQQSLKGESKLLSSSPWLRSLSIYGCPRQNTFSPVRISRQPGTAATAYWTCPSPMDGGPSSTFFSQRWFSASFSKLFPDLMTVVVPR